MVNSIPMMQMIVITAPMMATYFAVFLASILASGSDIFRKECALQKKMESRGSLRMKIHPAASIRHIPKIRKRKNAGSMVWIIPHIKPNGVSLEISVLIVY